MSGASRGSGRRGALKRVVLVVGLVLLGFAGVVAGLFIKTLSGNMAMPTVPLSLDGDKLVMIPDGYVALFALATGPDTVALIDCGNDKEASVAQTWLKANGKRVEAVFVTHGHPDHVGGCKALGAPVYAPEAERAYLQGDVAFQGPLTRLAGPSHAGLALDHVVADGDSVTVGDRVVRVFAAPGHTPGSAVYLVDGVLVFGDAATGKSDGNVRSAPWLFSDDLDAAITSVHALVGKLKDIPVHTFAFSHSGPVPAAWDKLTAVD